MTVYAVLARRLLARRLLMQLGASLMLCHVVHCFAQVCRYSGLHQSEIIQRVIYQIRPRCLCITSYSTKSYLQVRPSADYIKVVLWFHARKSCCDRLRRIGGTVADAAVLIMMFCLRCPLYKIVHCWKLLEGPVETKNVSL